MKTLKNSKEKIEMFCQSCGKEVSNDTKFCPHCGNPINDNQETYINTAPTKKTKKKKPFYLKWWFILIVVFLLIGVIGAIGGSGSKNATNNESGSSVQSSSYGEVKQSNSSSANSENEQSSVSESSKTSEESDVVSVESIISLIKSVMSTSEDGFSYFDVTGDDTGITISVATDGLASEMATAKSLGYDENYQPWMDAKDSLLYFYNSIEELVDTLGREDLIITVIIVNDQNYDNCLLMICEGAIVYDAMVE